MGQDVNLLPVALKQNDVLKTKDDEQKLPVVFSLFSEY